MLRVLSLIACLSQTFSTDSSVDSLPTPSDMSSTRSRTEQHRDRIVRAVVALYDNKLSNEPIPCDINEPATRQSLGQPTDVDDVWAPDMTFNDPLFKVTGVENYRAQFAALHEIFPTIVFQVYSVTWGHGSGKLTSSDDIKPPASQIPNESTWDVCVIDARATYANRYFSVPVRQTTHLRVTREANGLGKVIAHEDTWSFADLIRGVPLIGRVYNFVQPRMGAWVAERVFKRYAKSAGIDIEKRNLATTTLHSVYHPVEAERVGSLGASHRKGADAFAAPAKEEKKSSRSFIAGGGEHKEL